MPAVIRMKSGQEFTVDRGKSTFDVQLQIKEALRNPERLGPLMAFPDNRTPSRPFYINPNEVESVRDDGHSY